MKKRAVDPAEVPEEKPARPPEAVGPVEFEELEKLMKTPPTTEEERRKELERSKEEKKREREADEQAFLNLFSQMFGLEGAEPEMAGADVASRYGALLSLRNSVERGGIEASYHELYNALQYLRDKAEEQGQSITRIVSVLPVGDLRNLVRNSVVALRQPGTVRDPLGEYLKEHGLLELIRLAPSEEEARRQRERAKAGPLLRLPPAGEAPPIEQIEKILRQEVLSSEAKAQSQALLVQIIEDARAKSAEEVEKELSEERIAWEGPLVVLYKSIYDQQDLKDLDPVYGWILHTSISNAQALWNDIAARTEEADPTQALPYFQSLPLSHQRFIAGSVFTENVKAFRKEQIETRERHKAEDLVKRHLRSKIHELELEAETLPQKGLPPEELTRAQEKAQADLNKLRKVLEMVPGASAQDLTRLMRGLPGIESQEALRMEATALRAIFANPFDYVRESLIKAGFYPAVVNYILDKARKQNVISEEDFTDADQVFTDALREWEKQMTDYSEGLLAKRPRKPGLSELVSVWNRRAQEVEGLVTSVRSWIESYYYGHEDPFTGERINLINFLKDIHAQ